MKRRTLDRTKPFGEVHGMIGASFEQGGVYFTRGGQEAFAHEFVEAGTEEGPPRAAQPASAPAARPSNDAVLLAKIADLEAQLRDSNTPAPPPPEQPPLGNSDNPDAPPSAPMENPQPAPQPGAPLTLRDMPDDDLRTLLGSVGEPFTTRAEAIATLEKLGKTA